MSGDRESMCESERKPIGQIEFITNGEIVSCEPLYRGNPREFGTSVDLHREQIAEWEADHATAGIEGVGPDAEIVTNEVGAKQSKTLYRFDLFPPLAAIAVAKVLEHGATKYGANNWRGIPVEDHINHALIHIFAYLAGDKQDDHLEHAACRMHMALEKELGG